MAAAPRHCWCSPRLLLPLVAVLTIFSYASAEMYGPEVTELTESNFDSEVINSAETWIVKFYAPWCGHCKSSAPAFSKAAKRLYGVARVGVVNCDDHSSLAQRFNVRGYPTIKTFAGEGRRARRPSEYNGDRTSGGISSHIRNIMPSFVARVMSDGVDSFFNDLKTLPHVLLFTDKTQTSGLYKGMAAKFRKSIAFGEARKKDGTGAADRFHVSSFPTILVLPPGKSAAEDAIMYSGAMNAEALMSHFDAVAKQAVNPTGEGVVDDESAKEQKPVFAQPKAYSGEVETIASKADYIAKCGARKDGRLCVLGLLPGGAGHELKSALADAANRYIYDNLAFAVIDIANEKGKAFANVFGETSFVAVRARKGKFASMPKANGEVDISKVTAFVDRIVGGEVRYAKLDGLPEWDAERMEDRSEQMDSATNSTKEEHVDSDEGQCGTEPPQDGGTCSAPKAGNARADASAAGKAEL